jgi:hypothetical protein
VSGWQDLVNNLESGDENATFRSVREINPVSKFSSACNIVTYSLATLNPTMLIESWLRTG